VIRAPSLFTRQLAAIGMLVLLSGFGVTEVEFDSADVPPSEFARRLARQKGLPEPGAVQGARLQARLAKPDGNGPFAAVVLFPTDGGWRDSPRHWRERLNTWGYVTLEVGAEANVPSTYEPLNQVLDAIGALQYLQGLPYVNSRRVAVMGWSMGAETALGAIDASGWAGKQQQRFAAAVALYPRCDNVGQFFAPALVIAAELDDIARSSNCVRLVNDIAPGFTVPRLEIMPGAYHWFDLPRPPARSYDMTYEYNAQATEAAIDHVRSFLQGNL